MSIDHGSDRPVFKQIADDLRRRIASGELKPGDRLPSEAALIRRWNVARMTVRAALGELSKEGLTKAEHGRGVFVRKRPPVARLGSDRFRRSTRNASAGAFAAETEAAGMTPSQELLEVGVIDPPEHVASQLGLGEGEKVVVRRRRMLANDTPMQLADSYFPASWAQGTALEHADTGPGGSYARVEDAGHPLARFREELAARAPQEREVRALELAPGEPVVSLRRIAFDDAGEPVEVFESVVAADRHVFVYEFSADE